MYIFEYSLNYRVQQQQKNTVHERGFFLYPTKRPLIFTTYAITIVENSTFAFCSITKSNDRVMSESLSKKG